VALKNDGSVVVRPNFDGQMMAPIEVQSGVIAIAVGGYCEGGCSGHGVALKNDGTVVAWGQFGQGQTSVPVGLNGVTAIAAGSDHTVALVGTGSLMPSLNARPRGNALVLSWPTNAVGFTLQSTLDLTPPITWIDSTSPPAVIGAQFTVTNSLSGNAQFYRLKKL